MAKDTKTQPPERGTPPETTPRQPPGAPNPELATPADTRSAAEPSTEDKAKIRELEERLLVQSETAARNLQGLEQQLAELRRLVEQGAVAKVPPPVAPLEDGKVAIINQRTAPVTLHLPGGASIQLAPGSNTVDAEKWALAKRHPHVRLLLQVGVNAFSKDGLREAGNGTTKDLDVTNAILLIQVTTSLEALDRAMSGEERKEVVMAAEAQAKRIRDTEERVRGGR